jgi:hypothetical protein
MELDAVISQANAGVFWPCNCYCLKNKAAALQLVDRHIKLLQINILGRPEENIKQL